MLSLREKEACLESTWPLLTYVFFGSAILQSLCCWCVEDRLVLFELA